MYLLTELKEGLLISFRAVRANKMRSVLTTLGIVIGIVSVTLMSTAIEGVNRAFARSAAAFGTDVPVSYTHLDVYKRQDLDHSGFHRAHCRPHQVPGPRGVDAHRADRPS